MAQNPKKRRRQERREQASETNQPELHADQQAVVSLPLFLAGLLLLGVAIFASGMLVWQHFMGSDLPGCGPGSACAQATGSAWGRVPLINWPVSFLGLAYFIGVFAAWLAARNTGIGSTLTWLVRVGAVFSLLYIGVMVVGGMLCPYCIVSHIGNLGFLVVLETARLSASSAQPLFSQPIQRLGIGFVAVTIVLAGWQMQFSERIAARAERQLEDSTRAMTAGTSSDVGFTGRYLMGPEQAPVRLVIVTNYQCPACARIESEAEEIVRSRDDVSLSIKHFPMSTDCNRHVSRNIHPNSCWAARAAEAAGILRGEDGFWAMHTWLFNRNGSFTEPELRDGLRQLGYSDHDAGYFMEVMQSTETLRLVQADINEAHDLGLRVTPTIYINGTELRGWEAPRALTRAVATVAASDPPVADAATDQPPSAYEKFIDDWRVDEVRSLGETNPARVLGPGFDQQPSIRVDVWGDYETAGVANVDSTIRELLEQYPDARYTFRLFPMNNECNPNVPGIMSQNGCWAARVAEAAAVLYGSDGFWKMHTWLLDNPNRLNNVALRQAAGHLGFDAEELINIMRSGDVTASIHADTDTLLEQRMRNGLHIFINGKWLPRWELRGYDIFGGIFEELSSEE